ncbi:DNA helicase/exodeoxyribonuclease V, subunit A [Aureimonas altamirensis DSM 21988]|uniref:DNA 3'-5' helicase n=1 Tax=Aureimonas altamirensis DSM 21988 TaxID=1121026 RepID=A0ABY1IPA7_9HYPH|nr:double-strand break repair helicase AddA [Aureimonas altamirensis]SHJ75623.1 DNA helicase/exodeoxyribonuclease V, subunit A [Aureimonas altamirensis DSM 21988]
MSGLSVSATTVHAQERASDPSLSVFVAANAGSGKTHVLTMRVVRLLLSGVSPGRILCLTYTKAAAAEMQARVFATLSRWTRADDDTLGKELATLRGGTPGDVRAARRLFATALETPGGLKIQTIHAFCEAILHQFPLEANVPGHFQVMDDGESALLLAEARRLLVVLARLDGGTGADPALAEAFAEALELAGEAGLDGLINACIARRDRIGAFIEGNGGPENAVQALRQALGVGDTDPLAGMVDPPGFDAAFCGQLGQEAAQAGGATNDKLCDKLARIAASQTAQERYSVLRSLVFTAKGDRYKLGSVATKAVVAAVPELESRLAMLGDFLDDCAERIATGRLFRASRAALVIADRLERDYRALKQRRGKLDFEDLIVRTADLLLRREASAWVHYKLDRGIDHVLVDEAQDTSLRQWQVVRALVDEFFHGAGESRQRTVFAVGDEKQSIYSFQGASPAMFAQERRRLEQLAARSGQPFHRVGLHQSFRSAAEILSAVDTIFADETRRRGLSSEGEAPVHESARAAQAGLVEVWPTVRPLPAAESDDDWLQPIDHQPLDAPIHRLARRIAGQIEAWVGTPVEVKGVTRPLDAGDVIILVRKRSAFVSAMGAAIRALGNPAIRVAGADRLTITDHLAVQDLMAIGRTVANAEDELSLAEALKSPIFGFSDDDLMALALSRGKGGRPQSLYLALRKLAGGIDPARLQPFGVDAQALAGRARSAFERLETLRDRAGYTGVYGFYARLLGPEGGRAALSARLGRDTGEVLDAFLDLALTAEQDGRAGLDAFLADLAANPPVVRREMTPLKGEVRIMTVHAAKGLEAPAVFLVDPGSEPFTASHAARLIEWEGMPGQPPESQPGFLWCPDKSCRNAEIDRLAALERGRAEDEYRRLLYVGLTRAADRLVVCGYSGIREPSADSWAAHVRDSLGEAAEAISDPSGAVVAWRIGTPPQGRMAAAVQAAPARPAAMDLSPLPPEEIGPRPLTPSTAGSQTIERFEGPAWRSPVLDGPADPAFALLRGQMAHRLLQVLPDLAEEARADAARSYVARCAPAWPAAEREKLIEEVDAVLREPAFAPIFAPASRAEVAIAGTVELDGRRLPVNGLIDRLAVEADRVLLVDYKTNRPVPQDGAAIPEAHRRQMALYAALLAPLFPDRRIEAALLYTEGPVLHRLDPEALSLKPAA